MAASTFFPKCLRKCPSTSAAMMAGTRKTANGPWLLSLFPVASRKKRSSTRQALCRTGSQTCMSGTSQSAFCPENRTSATRRCSMKRTRTSSSPPAPGATGTNRFLPPWLASSPPKAAAAPQAPARAPPRTCAFLHSTPYPTCWMLKLTHEAGATTLPARACTDLPARTGPD